MEAIRTFLQHFHVTYAGQSLPAATQIVLFKLLEPRRQHLTEKERASLLASQNGGCEKCGGAITRGEADHIAPLRDAIAGQAQKFRLLCKACHGEVTDVVTRRPTNPIISVFNIDTYESFVNSSRPVQFVFPIGKIDPNLELVNVDVKRCRRSCMVESTSPWPVFCAHDEVVAPGLELHDFNWVDKGEVKT